MGEFILPRGYLSASAIGMMLRCPKQFEFRYIHDIIAPPSAAIVLGKAAHSTFEDYYQDVINSKPRVAPDVVADISVAMLDSEIDSSDFKLDGKEYDAAVYDIRGLTSAYVEHIGAHIQPISTEEQFSFKTQHGIEVLGFLDLKHEVGVDTLLNKAIVGIADYKVTTKKWNLQKLTNSLQFNIYTLATGITDIQIHNLVKGGTVKVLPKKGEVEDGVIDVTNKHRILQTKFDGSENQHFEGLIYQVARLITAGVFCPCDPESWCCNADWCGYWRLCRGANKASAQYYDVPHTPTMEQVSTA